MVSCFLLALEAFQQQGENRVLLQPYLCSCEFKPAVAIALKCSFTVESSKPIFETNGDKGKTGSKLAQ